MTEINKNNEVKFVAPMQAPKAAKNDVEPLKVPVEELKEYKEAAAAPAAEAVGRAQVMINKPDNITEDINKIIANPAILDRSEALFNAAEKSGYSYPEAATFATQEVV